MAFPDGENLSLDDIDAKIQALTLLKSKKLAEAEESKKPKKDKKKEKNAKLDVKVPKVATFSQECY